MKKILPIAILAILIVGGGAFFAGMKYSQSKNSGRFSMADIQNLTLEQRQQRIQQAGAAGGFRADGAGNRGGGFISGEVLSVSDNNVTVKIPDGGSKIVFFSDTTGITKSVDGTKSDIETGKTIMVSGTVNSDGSVTAANIQISPDIPNSSPNQ